jgi:hypothetical protein
VARSTLWVGHVRLAALERDLARGAWWPADLVPLVWSDHCVRRWCERSVAPPTRDEAERQLCQLLRSAKVMRERPKWIGREEPDTAAWLVLGEGDGAMAMPLRRGWGGVLIATTSMSPGDIAPLTRQRRSERARAKRAGLKGRRHAIKHQGRRPPAPPPPEEWEQ